MSILINHLGNLRSAEIIKEHERSIKLKNDEPEKQVMDRDVPTVVLPNEISEVADRFDIMSAMNAHHARNIRSSALSRTNSDEFFFDIINLIETSIDNIKNHNHITDTDHYLRVKNKINIKQLQLNNNKEKLKLLKAGEDKYKLIQNEITEVEDDIEVCRKVLLIAEKSTRIYQINTIGLPISIDKFIQQLKDIIEKSIYYTFSESNRNMFISQLDNTITLIDKIDNHVAEHYSNLIKAFYNNKLKSILATPMHFKKEDIFQQLIELRSENWENKTVAQKLEVYEIINASVNMVSQLNSNKSIINPEIETFNIYALSVLTSIYETDAHVFGDLSLDDIVSTEYIYTYKDQRGRTQADTTTMYAYMLRHIKEIDSPLSRRAHIKIKFPKEFQPGLIGYLEEESDNIKEHYYIIQNLRKLKKKISDINKLIPSTSQYLSDFLSSLGDKYNVNTLRLTDKVTYGFQATSSALRMGGFVDMSPNPPELKTFTIYDILIGRNRKYLSQKPYGADFYSVFKKFPNKYNEEMIDLIESVDIQADYTRNIESLKNKSNMKNDFYRYVDDLISVYGNKNKPYYLIENSSSLLVYAKPASGEHTGNDQINYQNIHPEHTPIDVISITTGQRLQFSSFRDMKNQIKNNKEIGDWFNYHFPLDYKMTPSELRLIKKDKDYSYLYENILDMYLADIDALAFSHSEDMTFSIFKHMQLFIIPAFFMSPLAAFLYGSLITISPLLGQAAIADTKEERDNYLKEAVFAMALEVAGGLSVVLLKRVIAKATELYSRVKSPKKVFSSERNLWDNVSHDKRNRMLTAGLVPETTGAASGRHNVSTINSTRTINYFDFGLNNRLREAIRSNMLTKVEYETAELYAVDILKQSNVITELQRHALIANLKKTEHYTNFLQYNDLFNKVKTITTMDDLLQIKPGELVVFTEAQLNSCRPVHTMVSIGNGRFTGIKNSLLDVNLGDGKKIITAEQLGQFDSGIFKKHGSSQRAGLNILAGYPKEVKYSYGQSMGEVVKKLAAESITDPAKCIAELLQRSGELSFEQAVAFYHVAKALYSSNNYQKSLQQLITNQKHITHYTELMTLPKGTIIAFHENDYTVKKLMVSLGNGEFAIRHADRLELTFAGNFSQLTHGKFGSYKITAGRVNLSSMRQASLLGKDSAFVLTGNKLVIRAHGAPSIINYMDSMELANVVKGLILRKNGTIDLKNIGAIELQSCFGAYGRYPSGQILANELGKKVIAYPLAYSARIAENPEWWRPNPKIFMPSNYFSFTKSSLVNQQHMRNHNFWNKLLDLYKKVKMTNSRVVRKADYGESFSIIESLTYDIAKLISKEINVADFLQLHTEYYSDGSTAIPLSEISSVLVALLKSNVPTDAQSFAEKIVAILSLNKFSFALFDTYISNETNITLS